MLGESSSTTSGELWSDVSALKADGLSLRTKTTERPSRDSAQSGQQIAKTATIRSASDFTGCLIREALRRSYFRRDSVAASRELMLGRVSVRAGGFIPPGQARRLAEVHLDAVVKKWSDIRPVLPRTTLI
jgi:hypothetical protein